MRPIAAILPLAVLIVAACGGPTYSASPAPSPTPTTATTAPSPSGGPVGSPSESPAAGSLTPIVVDTDLAADDILAIMVLLRDPAIDVRAITVSGTGEVH